VLVSYWREIVQKQSKEIRSILLPLINGTLLLPHSSMVEMLPEREAFPIDGVPSWVLGELEWSGEKIPLLALEEALHLESNESVKRTRVILISCLSENYQYKYLAIRTTGVPTLVQLGMDNFSVEQSGAEAGGFIQFKAQFKGQTVIIPDMLALEKIISPS